MFRGYGEMGLFALNNPVDVAIAVWPWGAYLGEDALETGVRCKVSSFRRYGPNTLPPAAKASGQYINSVLAKHEATRSGYDEAILLNEQGFIADGSGENVFVVRDGVLYTPPTSDSCLPGITRDSVIRIAQSLGYEVREATLVRTDLYFADEAFLCGTAAEVTPIASVDGQEIGGRGPVTKQIQDVFFATVEGRDERFAEFLEYPVTAPVGVVVRSGLVDRGALRSRSRARTSTAARRSWCSTCCARATWRWGRCTAASRRRSPTSPAPRYAVACSSGTAGLHACLARLGVGPGDEVVTSSFSFVASANVVLFQHATPVFADIDEQTFNIDPAAVEAAITPRTQAILPVHIFGYPCDIGAHQRDRGAPRRAGGRGRLRGARRQRRRPAGRRVRQPRRLRLLPEQADHHRRGRHDHDRRPGRRAGAAQHRQPGPLGQRRLAGAPAARVQLPDGRDVGGGRPRPAREAGVMLAERGRLAARYGELLAGVEGVELPYRGPHPRSWFIYYVRLAEPIDRACGDRRDGRRAASPHARTCPRSTCSPSTGAWACARGCCR